MKKVLSYDECAARVGIVRRTWERMLESGKGPAIVHVSERRRGHLEKDFEAWLKSRRQPAPDEAAAPRKGGRPRKVSTTKSGREAA